MQELIAMFERMGLDEEERTDRMFKLENYWKKKWEERVQELLNDLTVEEQAQVASLIDKHSQEMMMLLAQKVYTGVHE